MTVQDVRRNDHHRSALDWLAEQFIGPLSRTADCRNRRIEAIRFIDNGACLDETIGQAIEGPSKTRSASARTRSRHRSILTAETATSLCSSRLSRDRPR